MDIPVGSCVHFYQNICKLKFFKSNGFQKFKIFVREIFVYIFVDNLKSLNLTLLEDILQSLSLQYTINLISKAKVREISNNSELTNIFLSTLIKLN